jgi:hypothetical protein
MRSLLKIVALDNLTFACCVLCAAGAWAQTTKSAGAAAAPAAATPPQANGTASGGPSGFSPAEVAAREAILNSDRWKRVESEFGKWLSLQVVYTPQQVAKMRARLHAEVQKMSAAELQQFLDQWDAKLKVLLGKDADEARQWLGEYLSVIADGYRPTFLKKIGIKDVTTLSASQIEDELDRLRAERMTFQQQRAFYNAGQQQWVQRAQQWQQASQGSLDQAGQGTAAEYSSYQTPMAPKQYNYQPLPPIVPFIW